jgi:hypothetical protein
MGHLKDLDLRACGIIPLHAPPLGTHVTRAKQIDSSVAFAHHDTVIDVLVDGDGSVDANIKVD